MCVQECPNDPADPPLAHKYEPNHTCVYMSGPDSGCPGIYYADELTMSCTTWCPEGYFADDHTKFCRLNCTNG